MNVFFVTYNNVEVLDLTGPYDVFARANDIISREGGEQFNLYTIASSKSTIKASGGLKLVPDFQFSDDFPEIDVLIIPGSPTIGEIQEETAILKWIKEISGRVNYIVSICVGAFFTVKALKDELNGHQLTTHHMAIKRLQSVALELGVTADFFSDVRYLESGKHYSSTGVSAGMDLTFHLLKKLKGEELAHNTAKLMEYYRTINWSQE